MKMSKLKQFKEAGLTLIELLVTLAVLGILSSVAVPSYQSFIANGQVSAASGEMLISLAQARSEAMKLNTFVSVLPVNSTDWSGGWYLKTTNNSCAPVGDAFGTASALGSFVTIKSSSSTLSFSSTNPSFTFGPNGFPYVSCASPYYSGAMNGVLVFQSSQTGRENWVILSKTGRARICRPGPETCASE